MKSFILITLISFNVFAGDAGVPSKETTQVVQALLSNPELTAALSKKATTVMTSLNVEKSSVNKYTTVYEMSFIRGGFGLPTRADVKITEDISQAIADGPIKYKYELNFVE